MPSACAAPGFAARIFSSAPVRLKRVDAQWSAARSARECSGPWTEPIRSSSSAVPSPPTTLTTTGKTGPLPRFHRFVARSEIYARPLSEHLCQNFVLRYVPL